MKNTNRNVLFSDKSTNTKRVEIGSSLDAEKDGKKSRFRIVDPAKIEPETGCISYESPLGKSFLGKQIGDIVKVKVPIGEIEYKILSIE